MALESSHQAEFIGKFRLLLTSGTSKQGAQIQFSPKEMLKIKPMIIGFIAFYLEE